MAPPLYWDVNPVGTVSLDRVLLATERIESLLAYMAPPESVDVSLLMVLLVMYKAEFCELTALPEPVELKPSIVS